jgi:DNA-binding FadR family transcriptional regulator
VRTPFHSILEFRQAFEPTLAARAAERITQDEILELERSVRDMGANLDNLDFFLQENRRFHDMIAASSGNQVFSYLILALNWIIDGSAVGIEFSRPQLSGTYKAHERIAKAIAAGDPEEAREAMEAHVNEFATYLKKRYPTVLRRPIRWENLAP